MVNIFGLLIVPAWGDTSKQYHSGVVTPMWRTHVENPCREHGKLAGAF